MALVQLAVLFTACAVKEEKGITLTAVQQQLADFIYSHRSVWESNCGTIKLVNSHGCVILCCTPKLQGSFDAGVMRPYLVDVKTGTLRTATNDEYRTSENLGLVTGLISYNPGGSESEKRAAIEKAVYAFGG